MGATVVGTSSLRHPCHLFHIESKEQLRELCAVVSTPILFFVPLSAAGGGGTKACAFSMLAHAVRSLHAGSYVCACSKREVRFEDKNRKVN